MISIICFIKTADQDNGKKEDLFESDLTKTLKDKYKVRAKLFLT